jgi:hypothetical protein
MRDVQRDFHAETPVDRSRFFPDHGLTPWMIEDGAVASTNAIVRRRTATLNGRIVICAS